MITPKPVLLERVACLGDDAPVMREEAMAKGILIAAMDFSAAPEDEFTTGTISSTSPNGSGFPAF
jgi:hypothetical protein